MVENYKDWIKKVYEQNYQDKYVLETFFDTVTQYLKDPEGGAVKVTLDSEIECVERYLERD